VIYPGFITGGGGGSSGATDAALIADGSVSNTEFQYLNGVTSAIQTQFSGKVSSPSFVHLNAGNARASTNTNLVIYSTVENTGTAFTVVHSATLGSSIQIETAGVYIVNFNGFLNVAGIAYLVKKTSITNTPAAADLFGFGSTVNTTYPHFSSSVTLRAAENDYVYMYYTQNPSTASNTYNTITILGPF
jgi:hypothetical protein